MLNTLLYKQINFKNILDPKEFVNALSELREQSFISQSKRDNTLNNIVEFYTKTLTTPEKRKEFIAELIAQKHYRDCIQLRALTKATLSFSLEEYKAITEVNLEGYLKESSEGVEAEESVMKLLSPEEKKNIYITSVLCIIYILRDLGGEGIELSCELLIRAMEIYRGCTKDDRIEARNDRIEFRHTIKDPYTEKELTDFLSNDTLYNNNVHYDLKKPRWLVSR